jgi:ACR3 family arsenite efflux pump ArsB
MVREEVEGKISGIICAAVAPGLAMVSMWVRVVDGERKTYRFQ